MEVEIMTLVKSDGYRGLNSATGSGTSNQEYLYHSARVAQELRKSTHLFS